MPPDRLAARRQRVVELLLRGLTYRQIATEIKVKSTKTISDDVEVFLTEQKAEQRHDVDAWVALELSKVGRIEAEAGAAWERSQEDAVSVSVETARVTTKRGRGEKAIDVPAMQTRETRTIKGQVGDPAFLDIALKCTARRCELLGLDKPRKIALTNGQVVFLMPDNNRGDATPGPGVL